MPTGTDSPEPRPGLRHKSAIVPYTTRWSGETKLPTAVVARARGFGIAFADEIISDRDRYGALWQRDPSRPGTGLPEFGNVHSGRQRRAMRNLLCQVCSGPADRDELGTLWLLPDYADYHQDWAGWPERMATPEPPVCLACANTAVRVCPALRKGHVAIRVGHSVVSGVRGALYVPGPLLPKPVDDVMVPYEDPAMRWTLAAHLVRELFQCTIVKL
jgi:hypothetical protein